MLPLPELQNQFKNAVVTTLTLKSGISADIWHFYAFALSSLYSAPATIALWISLISQSTELNMGKPNQSGHDMVIIFKYCF